eukprot:gene10920-biopygen3531
MKLGVGMEFGSTWRGTSSRSRDNLILWGSVLEQYISNTLMNESSLKVFHCKYLLWTYCNCTNAKARIATAIRLCPHIVRSTRLCQHRSSWWGPLRD